MGLTASRVRMVGGIAGILFVVFALVGFLLPGAPPKANEAAKITTYLVSKRGDILASDFILGISVTFFLIFVASLRTHLGGADAGGLRPGAIVLAGGVTAVALLLAGTAVTNGAAFRVAAAGDVNLNTALYDTSNGLFFLSGFGFAAFFIGAALAGSATRALPSAVVATAPLLALIQIVGAIGLFAKSGFLAIGGAFGYISVLVSLAWVLAVSVVLLRPARSPVSAQPPPAQPPPATAA
jgi:hypothetical protein